MANQSPLHTQNLHDLLSARHFSFLADHDADVDVPTITVTPADGSPPELTEKYGPEQPPEEMNGSRGTRKAGRPRLDAAGAAVLSEDRRQQVRRAQRTYRLKKEATLKQSKQRVVDLEKKLNRVSSSFADMMEKLDPSVRKTSPALVRRLDAVYALLADGEDEVSTGREGRSRSIDDASPCPRRQSQSQSQSPNHSPTGDIDESHPISPPSPTLTPLPPSMPSSTYTYTSAHHEKTLTRHLHRLSLEHAYHLFRDPRSAPLKIYQVFRLVSCIQDRGKMDPYFRRLVAASAEEPLELLSLPFYCVGGAGGHYPCRDGQGRLVYPRNRRLPGRVLGGLAVDGGWRRGGTEKVKEEQERRLRAYGLGGVWFDCRDVEGYLREMGVRLDEGLFPEVRAGTGQEGNDSDAAEQLQASLLDSVESKTGSASASEAEGPSLSNSGCRRILDIDSFLSKLLQGLVILGRAPGFRRNDVISAFHSALSPVQS